MGTIQTMVERNKVMTDYLAGPMRGIPFFNFPAFDEARDKLRALGHEVISPADIDRENGFDAMLLPEDTDWNVIPPQLNLDALIERDLAAVRRCHFVVTLPGWQHSVGARAEVAVAQWAGKSIMSIEDFSSNL